MLNPEEKGVQARELFLKGYNCAQSVAGAFAPEMGLPEKEVVRLASGLGGGVGGLRLVCGAVTGMCVAAGWLLGYDDPDAAPEKKRLYALEQHMAARFAERFESLNCRELLEKNDIIAASVPAERTPEYYLKRPCARYVEAAAEILAETLNEEL